MRRARSVLRLLRALALDRRGGTMIEYGFIVALVVIAMFAAFQNMADVVVRIWTNVARVVVENGPRG